jgi:hypothetical protein
MIPCVPLAIYHDSVTDAWVSDGDMARGHRAKRCGLGRVQALLLVLIPIRSTSESGEIEHEREKGKGRREREGGAGACWRWLCAQRGEMEQAR